MQLNYTKQKHWYINLSIIGLLTMFVATTFIYSRLANLPTVHQHCLRLIIGWQARTQQLITFQNNGRYNLNIRTVFILRDLIHQNLFIQTIANDYFGFTCNGLFQITKYKYVELLLLNIVLIILFYRKFCQNLGF
ncbi:hypothetical protein BLA29_003532 [Euroglyphus maynei]|uniref:Transmembrane protein n=1 Tax=Euroglyphus maynei TaxID=6958 RepID=A0A1Y3BKM1_EURMA|nr:hypothetical protein BLA29_003532 [Euroglyphus maynei]